MTNSTSTYDTFAGAGTVELHSINSEKINRLTKAKCTPLC